MQAGLYTETFAYANMQADAYTYTCMFAYANMQADATDMFVQSDVISLGLPTI
jgi:hypothetical protein